MFRVGTREIFITWFGGLDAIHLRLPWVGEDPPYYRICNFAAFGRRYLQDVANIVGGNDARKRITTLACFSRRPIIHMGSKCYLGNTHSNRSFVKIGGSCDTERVREQA